MELWSYDVLTDWKKVNLWKIQTQDNKWTNQSIEVIWITIGLCTVLKPQHQWEIPENNQEDVDNLKHQKTSFWVDIKVRGVWVVS